MYTYINSIYRNSNCIMYYDSISSVIPLLNKLVRNIVTIYNHHAYSCYYDTD